jgi:hypothetical protein
MARDNGGLMLSIAKERSASFTRGAGNPSGNTQPRPDARMRAGGVPMSNTAAGKPPAHASLSA